VKKRFTFSFFILPIGFFAALLTGRFPESFASPPEWKFKKDFSNYEDGLGKVEIPPGASTRDLGGSIALWNMLVFAWM
jgi:hypothetical protein